MHKKSEVPGCIMKAYMRSVMMNMMVSPYIRSFLKITTSKISVPYLLLQALCIFAYEI